MIAHRTRSRCRLLALCWAAFVLHGAELAGQAAQGTVLDPVTNNPITGAVVFLEDSTGTIRATTLSDEVGYFLLLAPSLGLFRLRAERIGYTTIEPTVRRLVQGDTTFVRLYVSVDAVRLDTLQVEGQRRCDLGPDEALRLATIWEEAREALEAARWTTESALTGFAATHTEQELGPNAQRVRRERRWNTAGFWRHAFRSISGTELSERGFSWEDEASDSVGYYAPDAEALLSDSFLEDHCLSLVRGEGGTEGLVGIGLSPVRGRDVVEIEGVLWLDPSTARLQRLDFEYVDPDLPFTNPKPGGQIRFAQSEAGTWYVQEWWILGPIMELAASDDALSVGLRPQVQGFLRRGARVSIIEAEADDDEVPTGWVSATALDSAGIPLPGTSVAVLGTGTTVATNATGQTRLSGLLGGEYEVVFSHPMLDSVGFVGERLLVEVVPGTGTDLQWQAPSRAELIAGGCEAREGRNGGGRMVGRVYAAGTDVPMAAATVIIEWTDPGPGQGVAVPRRVIVRADGAGDFLICDGPAGRTVTVWAEWGGRESDRHTLPLERGAVPHVDLPLDLPSGAPPEAQGNASVLGTVVDAETGRPMPDVSVRSPDGGQTRLTDRRGRFTLPRVPAGRLVLSFQHLGHALRTDTVHLEPSQVLQITVPLVPDALELSGLTVTVQSTRSTARLASVLEHYDRGVGQIFLRADIEKMGNPPLTSILQRIQGMRLVRALGEHRWLVPIIRNSQSLGTGACPPVLFIDGIQFDLKTDPGAVVELNVLTGVAVEAVEVYRSAAEAPAEYQVDRAWCGVIAVWTR